MKKILTKTLILTALTVCMIFSAACGEDYSNGKTKESGNKEKAQSHESSDKTGEDPSGTVTKSPAPEQSQNSPDTQKDIAKITGAADEEGIYAIEITLKENAADKGVVEMIYYGAKGSPQENSVVNTFRIEYEKIDGLFEIRTFFDGELYQNMHKKDEVKVNNTFGALLRAGSVIISYAPDGEEMQEIFRADAESFFVPTK